MKYTNAAKELAEFWKEYQAARAVTATPEVAARIKAGLPNTSVTTAAGEQLSMGGFDPKKFIDPKDVEKYNKVKKDLDDSTWSLIGKPGAVAKKAYRGMGGKLNHPLAPVEVKTIGEKINKPDVPGTPGTPDVPIYGINAYNQPYRTGTTYGKKATDPVEGEGVALYTGTNKYPHPMSVGEYSKGYTGPETLGGQIASVVGGGLYGAGIAGTLNGLGITEKLAEWGYGNTKVPTISSQIEKAKEGAYKEKQAGVIKKHSEWALQAGVGKNKDGVHTMKIPKTALEMDNHFKEGVNDFGIRMGTLMGDDNKAFLSGLNTAITKYDSTGDQTGVRALVHQTIAGSEEKMPKKGFSIVPVEPGSVGSMKGKLVGVSWDLDEDEYHIHHIEDDKGPQFYNTK
jgi:hypothetical protein